MVKWLKVHVLLVFVEGFAVVQLMVVHAHDLLRHRATMVIARVREVLSSSLWDAVVTSLLFRISHAIYRAVAGHILLSDLDAGSCGRVT